ncbi:GNAT family N-acetyltransferase [Microbacterium sp. P04]|uniref:GNAT family N-acetyltransferase n=1 Tax=Microbacterium sp. P04 TaxID=3366947 RepID=UPI00374522F4
MIRAGVPEERDACIEIWLEALRARDGREQGADVAARARSKFDRPLVRFAVAVDEASGFALTVDAVSDGRVAVLELLAVAPGDAGRGLGRALVADAIDASMRLGYSALELHVRAGNVRAEKLYVASGFIPRGEPEPHPLGGAPLIRYSRPLPPP